MDFPLADDAALSLPQAQRGVGPSYFAQHDRHWQRFELAYPVISRRSGGLSLGVNLNPDRVCNFGCVYCCVPREGPRPDRKVDLGTLGRELGELLRLVRSGEIWRHPPFDEAPEPLRALRDIAFSGDGEPTACKQFVPAMELVDELRREHECPEVPMVLITNATLLHRPEVASAVDRLRRLNGKIWAKLDAGTEAGYRAIDRSAVPFARVVGNLTQAALTGPITIQTMLLQHGGRPSMDESEFAAYVDRLRGIFELGGVIEAVQLYTVARRTAEAGVEPVPEAELRRRADQLRAKLGSSVAVSIYP